MKPNNSNTKKVLMLVLSHYPSDPRVRREAEALVNNGYRVDIVCMSSRNELPEENFEGIRVFRILHGHTKENILKYLLLTIRFFIKAAAKINRLSRENEYSVIQIHNMPDYLVFTTIFQKLHGIPVILDLHDIMKELFKSRWNGGLQRFLLPFIGLTEKISWAYADSLITTSYGFKQCLLDRGVKEEKITLILNTADPHIFNKPKSDWSFKKGNPRFLYHGTVAERFGIHVAIEAIKKLKDKYPDIRFDIYGNYQIDYKEKLLALVQSSGLTANVFFHEYVSLEEISGIIHNTNFGLVPYVSDGFMDLALSTKTFEYVIMKLPVIASDIPSMRTIFNEKEIYYFKQNDPAHLADTLDDILSDGIHIKEKVASAAEAYRHLSWSLMVKEYVKLIEKVSAKNETVRA